MTSSTHTARAWGPGYAPPAELPGGWWEALGPLAAWVQQQLRQAYDAGYMAGRLDAARRQQLLRQ